MHQKALLVHQYFIYSRIAQQLTNVKVIRKDVPTDQEIQIMHDKANLIKQEYPRLRARAVVSLLETGKRRSEIANLKRMPDADIWTDQKFLYIRFTVRKKRKKSQNILQRTKKFNIESQHSIILQEYLAYLDKEMPQSEYLFPRGHCVFGQSYIFNYIKPIKPQEIWRIVKQLNPQDWPHLHRERRAVKVIRADEAKYGQANLETVYRIKSRLDLEKEQTAYNYIRRHETQRVEEEDDVVL